jgi:hypothetical protein
MARPIARLKLGYFLLPIEEAQNIRYAASSCPRRRTLLLTLASEMVQP